MMKADYQAWEKLCQVDMLAIDDLGIEPVEVMDFGNVLCPVVDLLTKRYDMQLFTIITTNLTPSEIREKYGDRIADRMNEMMVKIIFNNDTYRK
jgi:DNA replication protein DnaC